MSWQSTGKDPIDIGGRSVLASRSTEDLNMGNWSFVAAIQYPSGERFHESIISSGGSARHVMVRLRIITIGPVFVALLVRRHPVLFFARWMCIPTFQCS